MHSRGVSPNRSHCSQNRSGSVNLKPTAETYSPSLSELFRECEPQPHIEEHHSQDQSDHQQSRNPLDDACNTQGRSGSAIQAANTAQLCLKEVHAAAECPSITDQAFKCGQKNSRRTEMQAFEAGS